MDVIVKDNEVKIPDKQLLRYQQREETKAEIEQIDTALNPMNPWRMKSGGDVAEAAARGRRLKKHLADYSPPQLNGRERDAVKKISDALEAKILQGMPTKEEMRKNPAGMVDRHMKHERANKKSILAWKNAQMLLEPDSSDKDLCNFERLRPEGDMDRFRSDAQISGHMSYGNIPEWVWEKIFEKSPNSALEQVKAHEQEAKIDKRTLPRSDEQKRILAERLALARAKQAEMKDPVSPQEGESVPFEGA